MLKLLKNPIYRHNLASHTGVIHPVYSITLNNTRGAMTFLGFPQTDTANFPALPSRQTPHTHIHRLIKACGHLVRERNELEAAAV